MRLPGCLLWAPSPWTENAWVTVLRRKSLLWFSENHGAASGKIGMRLLMHSHSGWHTAKSGESGCGTMTEDTIDKPDKLKDFERNPAYERRVVVFYDVLGWRAKICRAGSSLEKIGELRRLVLLHSRLLRMPVAFPVNISTFSDNIVISTAANKEIVPYLLRALAMIQLSTVSRGFLLRGGVAIGDIYHDEEAVFGPALVRAYDLERTVAKVPRIVIDQEVLEECGPIAGFNAFENGLHFLDPFTADFIRVIQSEHIPGPRPAHRHAGLPGPEFSFQDIAPDSLLSSIMRGLKKEVRSPLDDKEYEKVAWLYDRIADRLGVPLANSYPRVRPGDLVE
jgi:hypothetical protein